MRIYLDVCCLNRPFDDLSIGRNRLEAEAVLEILGRVRDGSWELVGSEVVEAELSVAPLSERVARVRSLAGLRSDRAAAGPREQARAAILVGLGVRPLDALHVACAEAAGCDVLLTTDDSLLAKAKAHSGDIMVRVANPLVWIAEVTTP